MKFEPIDESKRATVRDVVRQNDRLHECLHQTMTKVDELAAEVRKDRHAARNRDAVQDARTSRIEGALGIGFVDGKAKPVGRRLAGIKPWQAILAIVGAMGGVQIAYQVIVPALWTMLKALHAGMMGG